MGLFGKGFSAVREEKQKQDENREKMGKNLWRFFLSGDGDEADVRFLTEEPVTFFEHTIKSVRGGKEVFDTHICNSENCTFCDSGDKPVFRGAFLIWDKRPYEYTDKEGNKKKIEGSLKLYVQGARVLSQLDRISSKYGLTNREVTIIRLGKGTSTTYTIEKGDTKEKLSQAEITNMLPERLRDMYNGTADSLYSIVEACLSNDLSSSTASVATTDKVEDSYSNLIDLEDDLGEESAVSQENSVTPKKLPFKSRNGVENSVKKMFNTRGGV